MKQMLIITSCTIVLCMAVASGPSTAAAKAKGDSGETLFKQHCMSCHPKGSNIINPQKTLQKQDREKNKVMSADDIVKLMRNPGPGMSKFDAKTIPDKDAHEIAEYVMKTF